MLLAEIRGHASPEIAGNEDYLTSTVFGHLRYVSMAPFWEAFFSRAVGLAVSGREQSLQEVLAEHNVHLSEYRKLEARFWPHHPLLGIPDLVLCFTSADCSPFVLIVEAKLWSGKSGFGERDQLRRYLNILKSPSGLGLPLSPQELKKAVAALLYLTPHESLAELEETSALCNDEPPLRALLFRAQWQDILVAAEGVRHLADDMTKTILLDVSAFLRARGLEYFRGFTKQPFRQFAESDGNFYREGPAFRGFSAVPIASFDASDGAFYPRPRPGG
jgi:hypothetical protein